jgi:hypothetical protein
MYVIGYHIVQYYRVYTARHIGVTSSAGISMYVIRRLLWRRMTLATEKKVLDHRVRWVVTGWVWWNHYAAASVLMLGMAKKGKQKKKEESTGDVFGDGCSGGDDGMAGTGLLH